MGTTVFVALFFLLWSGTAGYVVYRLLTRRESRRAEYQWLGAFERRTGAVVGMLVAVALFALIWWTLRWPER